MVFYVLRGFKIRSEASDTLLFLLFQSTIPPPHQRRVAWLIGAAFVSISKRPTPPKATNRALRSISKDPSDQQTLFAPWTSFELSITNPPEVQSVSPRLQSFLRYAFDRPSNQTEYLFQRILGMKPWYSKKRIRRFSDRAPFRNRTQKLFPEE